MTAQAVHAQVFRTADADLRALCPDGSSRSFHLSLPPTGSRNRMIYYAGGGWCSFDVPLVVPSTTVDRCYPPVLCLSLSLALSLARSLARARALSLSL